MTYRFWIQTNKGEVVEWKGLTEQQAKRMNAQAERSLSWVGVNAFGWGAI